MHNLEMDSKLHEVVTQFDLIFVVETFHEVVFYLPQRSSKLSDLVFLLKDCSRSVK